MPVVPGYELIYGSPVVVEPGAQFNIIITGPADKGVLGGGLNIGNNEALVMYKTSATNLTNGNLANFQVVGKNFHDVAVSVQPWATFANVNPI